MKLSFLLAFLLAFPLSGCGTMNAYTGAVLTSGEANYAGAKKNIQAADDLTFMTWADSACALHLGSLQRNATGNPGAVYAALIACPISNVGVVKLDNGQIQVQTTTAPATPTQPYTPNAAQTAK
jgi:hypothetical protein